MWVEDGYEFLWLHNKLILNHWNHRDADQRQQLTKGLASKKKLLVSFLCYEGHDHMDNTNTKNISKKRKSAQKDRLNCGSIVQIKL